MTILMAIHPNMILVVVLGSLKVDHSICVSNKANWFWMIMISIGVKMFFNGEEFA